MNENIRLMLQTPPTEDNAGAAYQQVAENRAANVIADEFRMLLEDTPTPAPAGGGSGSAPTSSGNPDFDALMNGGEQPNAAQTVEDVPGDKPQPTPAAPAAEDDDLFTKVTSWAKRAAGDVGGGLVEAPGQAVGGVIDALGAMDQFMQQMIPIGSAQLFEDQGNFDPSFISSEEMHDKEAAE